MHSKNHGMVLVSRYCSSACITSAPANWMMSLSSSAVRLITSWVLKNALAAVASFLRIIVRVLGRNSLERPL